MADRRQRIHDLVIALLAQRNDMELLDGEGVTARGGGAAADPAGWLERNRRLVQRYQALVRSAVTLDAMIEQELNGQGLAEGD